MTIIISPSWTVLEFIVPRYFHIYTYERLSRSSIMACPVVTQLRNFQKNHYCIWRVDYFL